MAWQGLTTPYKRLNSTLSIPAGWGMGIVPLDHRAAEGLVVGEPSLDPL